MPKPTKGPRLGGSSSHQKAILANLATSLFEHGRIKTTEPKARALLNAVLDQPVEGFPFMSCGTVSVRTRTTTRSTRRTPPRGNLRRAWWDAT